MNFKTYSVEPIGTPVTDYRIRCTMSDDNGDEIGTFGLDGVLLFEWFREQPELYTEKEIYRFATIIASQKMEATGF